MSGKAKTRTEFIGMIARMMTWEENIRADVQELVEQGLLPPDEAEEEINARRKDFDCLQGSDEVLEILIIEARKLLTRLGYDFTTTIQG